MNCVENLHNRQSILVPLGCIAMAINKRTSSASRTELEEKNFSNVSKGIMCSKLSGLARTLLESL